MSVLKDSQIFNRTVVRFNRFEKTDEFLLVGDRVIREQDARMMLALNAREVFRSLHRQGMSDGVKGHVVGLLRQLRKMRAHPRGNALDSIIESISADTLDRETLNDALHRLVEWTETDIILDVPMKPAPAWPPAQKGDLEFIDCPLFKRQRLVEMYTAAGQLEPGFTYTRSQVERFVSGCARRTALNDPRFPLEVLIRNMVDIGYLARDIRGIHYWLSIGPWKESMPANTMPDPESRPA